MSSNVERHGLVRRIAEAAERYRIREAPQWLRLSELSDDTQLDGLRANTDSIIVDDRAGRFGGLMTVYVVRRYLGDETVEEGDSFPVTFEGHLHGDQPVIDTIDVNTRSYFAGTEPRT